MAQLHYTAEVRSGLLLKLPAEAEELQMKPGDTVEIQLELLASPVRAPDQDPTIALLESWIAKAPTNPEAIREADEDLREFKRNMNLPRKEAGARLPYPEVE